MRKELSPNEMKEHIEARRDFRLDGWDQKDALLKLLKKAGFRKPCESHYQDARAYGGQHHLRNDRGECVAIVPTYFFGLFIDVNFSREQ